MLLLLLLLRQGTTVPKAHVRLTAAAAAAEAHVRLNVAAAAAGFVTIGNRLKTFFG